MALIAQQIAQVLQTDLDSSIKVYPSFEETITLKESDYRELPIVFVQALSNADEISESSYGLITSAPCIIYVFHNRSLDAVQLLDTIARLGFTTIEGKLGYPSETPFEIGGQSFHKWWPIGGKLEQVAEKYGEFWLIEQGFIFEYVDFELN